ncbi:MAG: hypothetical protein U1E28_21680 [Beijerinckiaceae bacterium]
MRSARPVLAVLTFCLLAAAPAGAADYSRAVAVEEAGSVWQGHFTGGNNLAPGVEPIPLAWVDVKERFASLRECSAWLHQMKRAYSTYEGWKGCMRIR